MPWSTLESPGHSLRRRSDLCADTNLFVAKRLPAQAPAPPLRLLSAQPVKNPDQPPTRPLAPNPSPHPPAIPSSAGGPSIPKAFPSRRAQSTPAVPTAALPALSTPATPPSGLTPAAAAQPVEPAAVTVRLDPKVPPLATPAPKVLGNWKPFAPSSEVNAAPINHGTLQGWGVTKLIQYFESSEMPSLPDYKDLHLPPSSACCDCHVSASSVKVCQRRDPRFCFPGRGALHAYCLATTVLPATLLGLRHPRRWLGPWEVGAMARKPPNRNCCP